MKQQPGKLGIREYVAIAIFMVGAKATEDTPALLYKEGQSAAWMIPILAGGIFFVALFLLVKTMSLFQNKNLFAVIQQVLGKYVGFLICLLILVINSFALSFDTRTYTNIIRTYYFTTTPNLIIYALLMFICAYGAKKGIQHVGSVSYIVIYYAVTSFFIVLFLSLQHSYLQAIFPIWGPGKLEVLKQSTQNLTLFASFFILTMLIPYMTSMKQFQKGTWIAFVFVSLHISLALLTFIGLFDTSLKGIGFPFHVTIRFISFGTFMANIETLFFPIWIMAAFIRFAAFLYINALMFGHLFKIKDFEFLIPSLATVYLLIGTLPETPIDVMMRFKPIITNGAGPTFAIISIMLWLVALLKGEFKHAKNKNSM
ncbi:GerAB/ArcD/ProY family transporter [Bacillus sp. V3B]|uniref:GerAB/ArcD/ProY family transporter n=1 Tax=Bacillus sp. V3B TaxID=2804915 RepID=UPI00210DF981|nr:GerAB/ArcD/ProY family transporter [Bacillus sp. V3B]MCQ6277210.1 GerAB/ArcD/ProY family transporter [Bacillus sp. V3B]